jgi:hypothetical protein
MMTTMTTSKIGRSFEEAEREEEEREEKSGDVSRVPHICELVPHCDIILYDDGPPRRTTTLVSWVVPCK